MRCYIGDQGAREHHIALCFLVGAVHVLPKISQVSLVAVSSSWTDMVFFKWDRAISSLAIRSALGFSFGVIFSVLLFKRRAWPVWLGTGFGAGRAWEEADGMATTTAGIGVTRC